jgi:hypothetical protein
MKRFVIGCLSVFAVLLIAGAIAAYVFLWRPARAAIGAVQQVQQIQQLDSRVQDRSRFTPPADGLLNEGDVERYFLVQESMRADLEGRLEELNVKYDEFQTADGRPRIRQILNAYADLFGLIRDAKEAQVEALNAQRFSLDEYGWVKQEVLAASGLAIQGFDLGALAAAAQSGEELEAPTLAREVPQANLDLVEPYRDRFEDLIGLAYFGL